MLSPEDFGLFGIALIAISALQTFLQPGSGDALVQREDAEAYLDAAWMIKIMRAFLMSGILIISAPFVARFFQEPNVVPLLYILGASFIVSGFGNPGTIYFIKDLEFHRQFIYELSGVIADITVSIILAFTLRNAFALAFGYLASLTALTVASYIIHSYRPKFTFDFKKITELFRYGRWIWGSHVLRFLSRQGISVFIGKVMGTVSLGLYQMSIRLTSLVSVEAAFIISQISFPIYSKLQHDPVKLREVYSKILKLNSLILTPVIFFIAFYADKITSIMLGEKWIETVPLIQILCFYGLFTALSRLNTSVMKGIGLPQIETRIGLIQLLIVAAVVFPLSKIFGILGVAFSPTISQLCTFPFELAIVARQIKLSKRYIYQIILKPFLISLIISGLIYLLVVGYLSYMNAFALVGILLVYGAIYLGLFYLLDPLSDFGIRRILNKDKIKGYLGA